MKELISSILRRAEPQVTDDVALMSAIILELIRIAVIAANEPEAVEDRRLIRELRLMLRKRLEEATVKA